MGSLFSGIGGFDLGFERAGCDIRWQVELDPFCRAVLAKHWPQVRRYEDVRTVGAELEPVDALVGGFPCQPHSVAGRRGGAADDRDLWPQFIRIIRDVRPRWVVAENVPGLLSTDDGRFFGTVLGDLAACGYDAEWDCLPAAAFGADHVRDRLWIVANRDGRGREIFRVPEPVSVERPSRRFPDRCGRVWQFHDATPGGVHPWAVEPDVGRVAHGVPARVDRLRGLGNAIVPQIAQWIAERIQAAEGLA